MLYVERGRIVAIVDGGWRKLAKQSGVKILAHGGDTRFRMFVLMPPNCGGFGMPECILISSRAMSGPRSANALMHDGSHP